MKVTIITLPLIQLVHYTVPAIQEENHPPNPPTQKFLALSKEQTFRSQSLFSFPPLETRLEMRNHKLDFDRT